MMISFISRFNLRFKSKLRLLPLLISVGLALGSWSDVTGQNLILNPSAEDDPLTNHWIQVSGPWTQRCGNPEAFDGSCYFFAGVQSGVAEIYQDIDVLVWHRDNVMRRIKSILIQSKVEWTVRPMV